MRFIRFILFTLLIVTFQSLSAQVNCYETTRKRGIDLYNKGEFQTAAKNFEAAKFCPDLPANNDLDSWLEKCVIVVKLSTKRVEFEAEFNEEQIVEVTTKAKTFKVSTAPQWCTITQQGKLLFVNCEDNLLVSPREAKITITAAGKTAVLEVFQAAADVELEFDPDSVVFTSQSETKKVTVYSNEINWTIDTIPSWLTAERNEDTLVLTCEKNTLSSFREAEVAILVGDDFFLLPISQAPGDTVLKIDKNEMVLMEGYSKEGLRVTCNMAGWEVQSADEWIEVSRDNDSIRLSVMENPSAFSRHGKVSVSCGTRRCELTIHQSPHVTPFTMPESELKAVSSLESETVMVNSIPSELVVYVDDSIKMITPFDFPVDFEHHSLLVGFERREFLFNEDQRDISFKPGLRFASITFTAPKNIGLRTGFFNAKGFGAYSHFQASTPLVKQFVSDSINVDGYHFMVGPVYSPIQYAAVYAGVGVGIHEGPTTNGIPNFGFDYEAGVMGFYKNVTVSMGFRNTRWGFNQNDNRTTFVIGVGGYLKRYYDAKFGYCVSDSRRWWSVNYMTRPVTNAKGVMFGDLGKEKVRTYLKAMYAQPNDSTKFVDASLGLIFTPVNGIIDFCLGAGAGFDVGSLTNVPTLEVEAGFIINIWRFPLTVMLHESDMLDNRHLCVDFGIGFHFGQFTRSSYK